MDLWIFHELAVGVLNRVTENVGSAFPASRLSTSTHEKMLYNVQYTQK